METKEIRSFCNQILSICDYMDYMETLHDCNDCKKKHNCEIGVKPGEQVRINCFFWEGEENG